MTSLAEVDIGSGQWPLTYLNTKAGPWSADGHLSSYNERPCGGFYAEDSG